MRIQPTRKFNREAKCLDKKFPSFKTDLATKLEQLLENPYEGESLGQSCYKVRLAITSKGKGKSGGARLITFVKIEKEIIFLLTIYDKSEKENIDTDELTDLLNQLE